jgi:hypothetical protein
VAAWQNTAARSRPLSMRARIRDVFIALAAVLVAGSVRAAPGSPAVHPLKAEVLYNVAKFVEWPPEAFPAKDAPLRICVLGEDPFGDDLVPPARKKVNGRSVEVLRGATEDSLSGCHIAFISVSEAPRLARVLSHFGTGVLTLSDLPRFAERGGTVGFVMEGDRVRFEINADSAHRAGLKISSKLLKLAKVIR